MRLMVFTPYPHGCVARNTVAVAPIVVVGQVAQDLVLVADRVGADR